MQMSAPLRRNAVCGPDCAAIFATNGKAMPHTSNSEVVCSAAPAKPVPAGRVPALYSGPHKAPVQSIEEGAISAPAFWLEVIVSNAHQLRVSAVIGQHQDHR